MMVEHLISNTALNIERIDIKRLNILINLI